MLICLKFLSEPGLSGSGPAATKGLTMDISTQCCAVILAAGEGKRMKSSLHKVLHPVCFKPMIRWITEAVQRAGVEKICVVAGHGRERLEAEIGDFAIAVQAQPLGTAHAVMQAAPFIQECGADYVFVLCGDATLITDATLAKIADAHMSSGADMTLATAIVPNPAGYGRILRDKSGNVAGIVEHKDATHEQRKINEINSSIYCFCADFLLEVLPKISNRNTQNEYYLTDTVALAGRLGRCAAAFVLDDPTEILGINDRVQLAYVDKLMRKRINEGHMRAGVTIIDPDQTYVGGDVKIGRDTVIYPNTILKGMTSVGQDCEIGPDTTLCDCVVGDRCKLNRVCANVCEIQSDVTAGPYVNLRPGTRILAGARLGDFVEIKNSVIGYGSKVPHLSYIGDTDMGEGVNIGCGAVTVNYDGLKKHGTIIKDGAFIGCNTNLVAPVTIGRRAYTAAGSTVTNDVPDDALAIARSRQENKADWVKRKRN